MKIVATDFSSLDSNFQRFIKGRGFVQPDLLQGEVEFLATCRR